MGRARRPSHSILPRSRAEQSLRASLDPARTYLQGGGYDSRQCRADTQLAMIGVSMRVTPKLILQQLLLVRQHRLLFFTLNREDFSFVIHLDRQPRTSRRREAQTGSRARSGSRSERTLDAVEHSRTLMEWWPFLIFHRGGLRIKVINNNRRDSDQLLEKWFKQQRTTDEPYNDAAILASFPGVGAFVLASVLSYAHDPVRLRNLEAFRSLGGIAPVTKQSGRRRQVLFRRARSQPLNNALHHWARIAVLRDPHSKDHYDRLRSRGHGHARALRGVMDRILPTAIAML